MFHMLLQGERAEKQTLVAQLQQAQAGNHNLTGQLSSMAMDLDTVKQAQLESASLLQVQALLTGLACSKPLPSDDLVAIQLLHLVHSKFHPAFSASLMYIASQRANRQASLSFAILRHILAQCSWTLAVRSLRPVVMRCTFLLCQLDNPVGEHAQDCSTLHTWQAEWPPVNTHQPHLDSFPADVSIWAVLITHHLEGSCHCVAKPA